MSQCDPTDLLCRRAELTADEQRRLRASIQFSLEVRLMSEILPEFERESRVRPGDDLLVARINARALAALGARPAPVRAPAKRRTVMLLVAAAVLLVAGLAGAWLGGARPRPAPEPAPAAESASATIKPALKLKSIAKPKPAAVSEPATPVVPLEELEPLAPSTPPGASASPVREVKGPEAASELFMRANRLRRQGRAGEAAALYELLLVQYPSAREVGPARLALGKYLQAKQPERALTQYRALAGAGGALRAEALWGISELATARGARAVAQQALADLLREFPDSPYAEVARERATHDRR